jgi:sugar phosphate isomerase/epimerase
VAIAASLNAFARQRFCNLRQMVFRTRCKLKLELRTFGFGNGVAKRYNREMKSYSRREFSKLSLAALSATAIGPVITSVQAAEKPNSKIRGVQIGLNVPYSFANMQMSADDILKSCVQLGVSGLELRTQPVEVFLGAPSDLVFAKNAGANGELVKWRKSAPIDRAKDFRKKYKDAGVLIEIAKVDGIFKMTDEELDYVFKLAKALGGRAISTEISKKEDDLKRVGEFADKHKLMVGYHGHAETKPEHWERAFGLAKYNGANVDLGHFVAGNNTSPVPFIKEHHDRITHVHVKDRKMHNGGNTPFGEGDTPIGEVLRLIRDNKWPIQATIEFEYKVPAGSDRMTEIARAVKFCRNALMA